MQTTPAHHSRFASLLAAVFLGLVSGTAYGQNASTYDMERIHDAALPELEVLQDWRPVATTPPTRQKIVEITQCEFENGRKVRIPVTFVKPDTDEACHFIVSHGNLGPTVYKDFDELKTRMLLNNVGFVLPALGPIAKMKPDGANIEKEMNQLFAKTGKVQYIKTWFWGAAYMRAITAALKETDHFRSDKIATDGRSKSAAAACVAMIHYPGVTGLYARVIPSSSSPEYYTKSYQKQIYRDNEVFYRRLAAGEIKQLGTLDDGAYEAMRDKAKRAVAANRFPRSIRHKTYNAQLAQICLITENLDMLKRKGAKYHFFVGTNDNITMDVPGLAAHHPDYPVTYFPAGRHGGTSRFLGISGTPDTDEAKANRIAFFSEFYLGEDALLEKPEIRSSYDPASRTITATVTFREDTPKSVALHFAYDRYTAGSEGYEYDVWQEKSMVKAGSNSWSQAISVPEGVETVSLLSFQAGAKSVDSYSSSNYVTVETN